MNTENTTVKGIIFVSETGVGKTIVLQAALLMGMMSGLRCMVTAVMSEQSVQLRGLHLAQLFSFQ